MLIKITVNTILLCVFLLCKVALAQTIDEIVIVEAALVEPVIIAEPVIAEPIEHIDQLAGEAPAEQQSKYWLDSSHDYIGGSADGLVSWVDSFFAVPRYQYESASSSLRLRTQSEWEEGEGNSFKVKLRGKIRLPRAKKRISLVFTDDEGDDDTQNVFIKDANNESKTNVGLSVNVRDGKRFRVDYGVRLSSSFKIKVNTRFRYQVHIGEYYVNRFTNTVYFNDGEGFGTTASYELDRVIDKSRFIRWSNKGKFAEDIDGVDWSSQLRLSERLNEKSAISKFIWASGDTRPDYLTTSYGLGLTYRRSFLRSWLFYELEPRYIWRRDTRQDNREGVALFTIRFEALIDKSKKQKKW
jgi:hypothetical protein